MKKEWNEITVMLHMTKEEAIHQLLSQGYIYESTFTVNDDYYLPVTIDRNQDTLSLLNQMILIRQFDDKFKITIKHKDFAADGSILSQTNTNLEINSKEEAEEFLKALKYTKVMHIKDDVITLVKDNIGFVLENVNDGKWLMVEIEENENYPSIDLLIHKLNESGLKYDESDYFVKKAKLVYEEQYGTNY